MRYFFHVRDNDGVVADREGSELPDIATARQEARATARDFIADELRGGPGVVGRRIEISDTAGTILEDLPILHVLH